MDNLIIEGSRRLREWEQLQEELPNLDLALKFTDRPVKNVNLNVEEWKIVSYINPKNTMRQISKANNMNDLEIRRIVYGLLQAGLVEMVRPVGQAAPLPPGMRVKQPLSAEAKQKEKSLVGKLISRVKSM